MPSVFLSYSHKDRVWKDRLKAHLGVLERQGLLDIWDDRRIEGGADWFEEVQEAVARASVAVLLISADFLTSKFIRGEEVPRLLQRRKTERLPVIPVLVHPCVWDEVTWLREIQARPLDGRPLASFTSNRRNEELVKIAKEVLEIVRQTEARDPLREKEPREPKDNFLDRVEAVCRLREPEAEIRRLPGIGKSGGYLRVVRRVGAIRDMYPVGAFEHGISQESFQAFFEEIDAPYRRHDPGMISYLVYGGAPAPADLVAEAGKKRVHLVSFIEYQGLIDFRTYLIGQTVKLAEDPIYPPRLYVPQRMRTLSLLGREEDETADALATVREWLDSPHGRFLVLLGDFGTGKTFLLHELARRMGEAEGGLVPILLQMRSLEKGRSLDALLAQHFAQEKMEGFSPAKFRYMLEQGRVALLFDGFDELALRVTYSKAADHFETLLQAATGNAKVVLTSRRQHFLSESQVKTTLAERVESLSGHRLAILQPFTRKQVRQFLVNFFEGDKEKAEARLDLINRVQDLLGLSSNPRLLGFIADLPEDQLVQACTEGGEITAAKLYELLLNRWLVFEFERVHPKGAPPGLSVEERWQAVTLLAMKLWQKTDRFINLSDLSEEAARVVRVVGPTTPDSEVVAFQVGSGTLLVRDEEGNFSFLHQSILEWLVARSAAEGLKDGLAPDVLAVREISPLMADFFASLAGRKPAVAWAKGVLSAPAGEVANKNALLILDRLKEKVREPINLAGQDLRGQDFSGQDLSGADLSGADLTAARLIGTRLSSARLVKARLRDADLSTALLNGADLTEADLTGARLTGADLRGVYLEQARLRGAKLVGANVDSGTIERADTSGAVWSSLSELRAENSSSGSYNSIAWSPDGELLASATGNVIRLWEIHNGREIRTLSGHQSMVNSVTFSPDGKTLASASVDETIRLWQVDSGREIRTLSGHQNTVNSVVFSLDGKTLASGSDDKTVRLWQVDSGREIRSLSGHQNTVRSVAFSPDSKTLASASDDKTVRLWQVDSGRQVHTLSGHQNPVYSMTFSPDGKILASSSYRTIRIWQVDSGRQVHTLSGHQNSVWSLAFSPDGKTLASASDDQTVRLWQVDSGQEIRALSEHGDAVNSVAFSPDGKTLATGCFDPSVQLWQVDSGREIRALSGDQPPLVLSVAFSPDGKSLAGGSYEQTIWLWQVDSGRKICVLSGHESPINSVAFSPDGQTLASGSDDATIRLWQVDSEQEIYTLISRHRSRVISLAFSSDGKTLASGSEDRTVRLWQVASGREIRALQGHQSKVLSVAFSPDGQTLASSSFDNTVRLWQIDSGQEIRALSGHQKPVWSVAFNPDGKTLASGSGDGTIRLWDVATGRGLAVLLPLPEGWVAFSPDGRYKFGGVPAGGFWHAANLCRFEIGELDDWVPGLRLADDASFFDLPTWKPEVRVPDRTSTTS